MAVLIACVLIPLLTYTSALEINATCTTPNGETVKCIPISNCDVIKQAVVLLEESVIDFARKSQCGYDGQPLVCCGTHSRKIEISSTTSDSLVPGPTTNRKQPNTSKPTVCGIQTKQDRIVGGQITDLGEFPWMVVLKYKNSLGNDGGFRCSGTLISPNYVVTAAQCLYVPGYNLTEVRLGEWDLSTDPDCEDDSCSHYEDIAIEEQIPHTFYNRKHGNNDIALLRLGKNVTYTEYVRPICLPPGSVPVPLPGVKMQISGWGVTESGDLSKVKLKAQVPVVSNTECVEIYPNTTSVGINQVCAGGEEGVDACRGDSGGPLMRLYEADADSPHEQWYQEGIIYRGLGCGGKGVPSLYTRIARYNAWIFRHIQES